MQSIRLVVASCNTSSVSGLLDSSSYFLFSLLLLSSNWRPAHSEGLLENYFDSGFTHLLI
jgi:hypothetical protein